MGEPVGFATRGYDGRYIGNLIANRKALVGPFPSMGMAQRGVEASVGRALRWTRTVFEPAGEVFQGTDPAFWPLDFGASLVYWNRADRGVVVLSQSTELVRRWNSNDGANLYAATAASGAEPTLVPLGPGNEPTVRFPAGGTKLLTSNFSTLAPPFTVAVAAKYAASGAPAKHAALSSTLLKLRVTAADSKWEVFTNTSTIVGPVAQAAGDVISVISTTTDVEAFANGTSFGTSSDQPAGAVGVISLSATGADWSGDLSEAVVVNRALTAREHTILINYMKRRMALS